MQGKGLRHGSTPTGRIGLTTFFHENFQTKTLIKKPSLFNL